MFTVTDPGLIDSAILMLKWPFSYVSNQSNVNKFLAPHYSAHPGLDRAVAAWAELQKRLSDLPSHEAAWRKAMELRRSSNYSAPVHTDGSGTEAHLIEQIAPLLDTTLYESVCGALHRKKSAEGKKCTADMLNVLAQCVWLSEHISLCVLGVARAALNGENVRFEIASPSAQAALRRAWFGVAFDRYARLSDGVRLELWGRNGRVPWKDIPFFFCRQWRLDVPTTEDGEFHGTIHDLLSSILEPSSKLLAACLVADERGQLLRRRDAAEMGCADEFDLAVMLMQSLPMSDRIFEPTEKGLALGSLQLEPGLLSIAEYIARQKIGETWHDEVGHEMARYLARRIEGVPGVRVVEVELRQEGTTDNTPVDVDLFVVDERIGRVYAVQCKHLESSFHIGLLDWLERFRRPRNGDRKGLDKAVQQLSELRRLTTDDLRVRQMLVDTVGLTSAQIDTIRPIVVHNIWNLDFWRTDQGICFYDLHTFSNAVKGRERTTGMITADAVHELRTVRDNVIVDVSDPDELLAAYLNGQDSLAQDLARFDAIHDVRRSITVGNRLIVAEGLGL